MRSPLPRVKATTYRRAICRPSVHGARTGLPLNGRAECARKADPAELYAALDLGTNSCRMLIAQPKGNQFHVVDSFSKSVQLGLGLEASGRLSRAVDATHGIRRLRFASSKLEKPRRQTDRGWWRPKLAGAHRMAPSFWPSLCVKPV